MATFKRNDFLLLSLDLDSDHIFNVDYLFKWIK